MAATTPPMITTPNTHHIQLRDLGLASGAVVRAEVDDDIS